MKKKLIIVPVAVVVIAGGFALTRFRKQPDDRILISGNLELHQADISFKTAGRIVERNVDEGDAVRQGQVVARLDREQLLQQREAQRAALAAAEAQLAQARTALEWQRESVAADLAARHADIGAAEARLQELKTGSRPQEIQEARAAVAAARAEAERAAKDFERAQKLYKDDDISTSQFDQFRARHEAAAAALRQVEQRAALVAEGPRSETIAAQAEVLNRARAGLQAAQANQIETRRREQEIAARTAEIARARAQIALVEAQLADTEAVSPVSGVVLVKSAEPGEVVAPGVAVLTVGDVDHPWVRGYISERDLGRVKLGAKVRVTTDSFPGKIYWGRVTFIASEAEFTPKQIQTREERVKLVYRVKIDVENPNRELKNNMPVDAEILL
ncbi:MAG: efflux RND transporter periplasmic adaptor subunit [Bryobacteraceae bacterium]